MFILTVELHGVGAIRHLASEINDTHLWFEALDIFVARVANQILMAANNAHGLKKD